MRESRRHTSPSKWLRESETQAPIPNLAPIYLVVLTATIVPAAEAKVGRRDPELRRQDYLRGLRFWLQHPDPRLQHILFLENSGDDLAFLRLLVERENPFAKQVEFISIVPAVIPAGLHYGWGELRMLDQGFTQSRLVRETTHMIKATGRLTFAAISRLLDRLPTDYDAVVECRIPTSAYRRGRNVFQAVLQRQGAYASTQLALFAHSFYRHRLLGLYQRMKPDTYPGLIENLLHDELVQLAGTGRVLLRFPVNCDPSGIGASAGDNYDSATKRALRFVRATTRWTGLWI